MPNLLVSRFLFKFLTNADPPINNFYKKLINLNHFSLTAPSNSQKQINQFSSFDVNASSDKSSDGSDVQQLQNQQPQSTHLSCKNFFCLNSHCNQLEKECDFYEFHLFSRFSFFLIFFFYENYSCNAGTTQRKHFGCVN